jgi:ATP-dependent protease ClpP protease subunit
MLPPYSEAMEIWYTLTGDVDGKSVQEAIQSINAELYSKPVTRMKFLLASGGGDVGAGVNLFTYLKALPIDVETIGFGEVDAAATLVFLAGKSRVAIEDTQFFFHEGRYTVQDRTAPVHTHEEAISVFRRELHNMIYIIARETSNDTEVVANMLRRSKIMRADEAQEFGLVHQIVNVMPLKQQEEKGIGFGPKEG